MQKIIVCTNFRPFSGQPSCAFRGSEKLADYLEQEISNRNLNASVERSICLGHCPHGPNVRLPGEEIIHHTTKDKLDYLLADLEKDKDNY